MASFATIQLIIYGGFIAGTYLIRVFIHKVSSIFRYGVLSNLFFLVCLVMNFFLMPHQLRVNVFFMTVFTLNTGLIFYTLHRKAIESVDAPMGIKMAVFSSAMNFFGFLGSSLATAVHF
ncbi:MAG: hypothetical protein O7C59_05465 [Rickettsia endosymbiont of Ixodes persulcatus]|nr:hypothetical protein [Rickettsia endosymbiont of Ixodes persulcatus]